jgi:hypothetical protein
MQISAGYLHRFESYMIESYHFGVPNINVVIDKLT